MADGIDDEIADEMVDAIAVAAAVAAAVVHELVVPEGGARSRADRVVADLTGMSRSYVQKLIQAGHLTSRGELLRANDIVEAGAELRLVVPAAVPLDLEPETVDLSVVYEDADLLIVDKPSGLVVHPSAGHSGGTLVNALLGRGGSYGGIAGVMRPGIVHRLDRDTSGLLMVAKTDAAQASLQAQLKSRRIKKTYLALAWGSVAAAVGRIEAPIGRDPKHRIRMAVVPDGRPSVTGYRVRERFPGWTLLELDLVTGRTHQIRVHLAAIGHPVAGDPIYGTGTSQRGPDGLARLFLHAWRLELSGPRDGALIRAEAPLPAELESVLERLRRTEGRTSVRPHDTVVTAEDETMPPTRTPAHRAPTKRPGPTAAPSQGPGSAASTTGRHGPIVGQSRSQVVVWRPMP